MFSGGMGEDISPADFAQTSLGGTPAFVKLAPGDKGDGFPLNILKDPRTFTPQPGPKGEIHAWGIYGYTDPRAEHYTDDNSNVPEFDGVSTMIRTMKYQHLYMGMDKRKPEEQFVDVLMERKKERLKRTNLGTLPKQDVIVKIYLAHLQDSTGQPRVWRRFRVSAGIKLSVLQDKAIAPIMGWVRNLHAYTLTDYRDGSVYGPEDSRAVDMAHVAQVGYDFLPDDKYMLAHVFGKGGDKIGYLYDFGDKWDHTLVIERILSVDDSDGSIKIVDGRGMCPGENMQGSFMYSKFMEEFDAADYVGKQAKKREILDSPNYKGFGKPPALFDVTFFDINAAHERLSAALASTNSIRSGAKTYTMPLHPQAMSTNIDELKKGQSIVRDFSPDSLGYWQETTSTKKDKKSETVCGLCGKPGGVEHKTCSGCRAILYCSPAHQKEHWKSTHRQQCSRKYIKTK
ncbi:MUB1/samB family protein [Pleurotus pulmonarius]